MILPGQRHTEIIHWQQRLARALEQAGEIPNLHANITDPDHLRPIGNRAQLHCFIPAQPKLPPVLIIYSLVNRPFILDLTAQRSWLRRLREAGHPLYLLDWQEPCGTDRFMTLDEHLEDNIAGAARQIRAAWQGQRPHLLGICQGGTFAICLAARHPDLVGRMVNLVTPVDFHTPNDQLSYLVQRMDFEQIAETFGNLSAHWLNAVFIALKPYRLLTQRYIDFPELADKPQALEDFLRLERWMYDSPNQPATAFAQFATRFYQQNALINGSLEVGGKRIKLTDIQAPILNIYAEHDHLVPPAAAQALGNHIPHDNYHEIGFAGGHLGVFISHRAHRELVPEALAWLAKEA